MSFPSQLRSLAFLVLSNCKVRGSFIAVEFNYGGGKTCPPRLLNLGTVFIVAMWCAHKTHGYKCDMHSSLPVRLPSQTTLGTPYLWCSTSSEASAHVPEHKAHQNTSPAIATMPKSESNTWHRKWIVNTLHSITPRSMSICLQWFALFGSSQMRVVSTRGWLEVANCCGTQSM